ncbi:RNHCP domain-containing protein [Capsulimonas corticalis]|uniref:RNHCP domain-containing protein n=1 Tax=Capsulimonas corticalis TaxID=2219043 RepID=A0A402CV82_9BACT|nr:RNHCP domain-containing protein [Capsulimonas corticalis]BDI30307.1 RNHCP domain-containing protein [Capsulimonas corticalis]
MKPRPERGAKRRSVTPQWFQCVHCGQPVVPDACGTEHRNHCSRCLWSKHVDDAPGDRAADCGGAMEPVAVWVRKGGEWAIIHRCVRCGAMHSNRIAGDDSELVLISLAVRPLSQPPFPLERLAGQE